MQNPDPLLHLDNEHLSFRLNADASGELVDRETDTVWRMTRTAVQETGPIVKSDEAIFYRVPRAYAEEYAGHFRGERQGDAIRFVLLGRLGKEMGSFVCRFRLDGPWLEVRVEDIDAALPSLIFPPPFESESLVIPAGIGQWIREARPMRLFHTAFGSLSMRWFGGLRGDDGWIGILAEGHTDAGVHLIGLNASPGWLKSHGEWRGPRAVRYRLTKGRYVGQAKVFREWAKEHRLYRSLAEKIDEVPRVASLIGGRILSFNEARTVHREPFEQLGKPVPHDLAPYVGRVKVFFTHADAARVVSDARELGMVRGLVNVRGWLNGGYDETHPDVWPPEAALGTPDELAALLNQEPFVGVLLDNYQDIYEGSPSFPEGAMRLPGGELAFGGVWAGGQAYLVCSRAALDYARRNWEQLRTLRPGGMFIDTTTASPLYECYDPDHPLTRADDERHKVELLRLYRSEGMMVGSEESRDFGVDAVDWLENRHAHHPGESIPLWPLVYHDAVVCCRYCDPAGPDPSGRGAPNWLADMLWGYALHWRAGSPETWQSRRDDFRASLQVDAWHARVGRDKMVAHHFPAEDSLVELAEFSSGALIAANFSGEPRQVEGRDVPAGGYALLE